MKPRPLPCGPTAVILEVDGIESAIELAAFIRQHQPLGLVDLVPAATTVLAEVDSAAALRTIEELAAAFEPSGLDAAQGELITIETVYDGADLAEVAAATGMSIDDVITAHSDAMYVAAFCGFVPGFTYLTGLDPRLHLSRRESPRTQVPAGSVAMATQFTGVYPTSSPGGWNLLGRTDAVMWDPLRPRPALVEPGDRVRFVPVGR